jgi:hypothetical protein
VRHGPQGSRQAVPQDSPPSILVTVTLPDVYGIADVDQIEKKAFSAFA